MSALAVAHIQTGMSRRSARLSFATLAALLALAGCAGGGFAPLRQPPTEVAVAGRAVVIGGPQGYCVDRAGSRLGGASPFVLLGSCASIAEDWRAGAPPQQAVLTAAVSPPGDGEGFAETLPQLEAFLTSPVGRAALARDGMPDSVTVLSSQQVDGALLIHLRDTSENVVPNVSDTYWRGLFEVNGHLVTVSVMSFVDQPLGIDAGTATLTGLIDRIRQESRPG